MPWKGNQTPTGARYEWGRAKPPPPHVLFIYPPSNFTLIITCM